MMLWSADIFFSLLKGSLFLFYINLMLEVNHEYKNYIAYVFLGVLGTS